MGPNNVYLQVKHRSCFLFNLSYNVMIMCEWHQLMYIAIITPSKPTTPPDFRCISPFIWQQSPKCHFFGQITTPKITLIYRQVLIQVICSKMKSLHLQQTSRSGSLVSDWKFTSQRFPFRKQEPSLLWMLVLVEYIWDFLPKGIAEAKTCKNYREI